MQVNRFHTVYELLFLFYFLHWTSDHIGVLILLFHVIFVDTFGVIPMRVPLRNLFGF
jgi:hypothetical protein